MSMVDNSDQQKDGDKISFIPLGTDYPILQKIKWAESLFDQFGKLLADDRVIQEKLHQYKNAIISTGRAMDEVGVLAECTDCAVNDGGSCCGRGIESKFTVILLLINRLMGSSLAKEREDAEGCWFLGPKGCKIIARHTICVNYLCRRLQDKIPQEKLQFLQHYIGAEVDAGFVVEEELKRWFQKKKI